MILDRQGKLFGKLNVIDLLLIVVVLAAAFFGMKLLDKETPVGTGEAIALEFYTEEAPTYAAEAVKVGDPLTDDVGNISLGTVTAVEIKPSVTYTTNDEGEIIVAAKEGYSSIRITGKGTGKMFEHGAIFSGSKYGIGHSLTLRAGLGKIWLRVSGITPIAQ